MLNHPFRTLIHFILLPWTFWLILPAAAAEQDREYYSAEYRARIVPESGTIEVELNIEGERLPSQIVMPLNSGRYRNLKATDPLTIGKTQATWRPRGKESRLRYEFIVDHKRSSSGYDSLMTDSWAIFRADKLVPSMRVTAPQTLHSRAAIEFEAPEDWSVITPYAPVSRYRYEFDEPTRRFDRPLGWMLAGKIGSRGEQIGGTHAIVAAPVGESARRQDMLAFLNWNLPRLLEVFTNFPKRVLIVTAGDPMWRGGLSGPASLYVHARLPLISENRTSTPLHELLHVALGIRSDHESDWIVEGLAEFYSLEILRRSSSISQRRYEHAMQGLHAQARGAPSLFTAHSSGQVTARAVLTMQSVDTEIRKLTDGDASLDDVARKLAEERGTVSLERLQEVAAKIAGRPLVALQRKRLMQPIGAPSR